MEPSTQTNESLLNTPSFSSPVKANQTSTTPPRSRFVLIGLALILLGILIGVLAARFFSQNLLATTPVITPVSTPTSTSVIISTPSLSSTELYAVIGEPQTVIPIDNNWISYENSKLKFSLKYPPTWKTTTIENNSGVILYPPESDPETPSPSIRIDWLNTAYDISKPTVETESQINSIEISGITGREYQDNEMTIPLQSSYIELPHQNGILFIDTTIGPSEDYRPQLNLILSTFKFIEPTAAIKHVCPTTEWVDCMPGPDMIKPQCDATFLTWAKANCPGFKGAAL